MKDDVKPSYYLSASSLNLNKSNIWKQQFLVLVHRNKPESEGEADACNHTLWACIDSYFQYQSHARDCCSQLLYCKDLR
jgi:hypothetical protein